MTTPQKLIKYFAICLAIFIILAIFSVLFKVVTIFIADENTTDYSNTFASITNLEIDVNSANISIISGDEFKVEAKDVSESFQVKEEGSTIKIKENSNWFSATTSEGSIVITIPDKINQIELDTGLSNIEIIGITASNIKIEQGTGKLTIDNSNFSNIAIDGGAGVIKITSSILNNLDLDAGVGEISITAEIYGNSNIECGVGTLNLTLMNDDYLINVEKGLGSLSIAGENYKSDTTFGTGTEILRIEGGVGTIDIDFIVS